MTKHLVKLLFVFPLAITSCCDGGGGGSSVVKGKVLHHDQAIPNAMVYIKYNAKDLPSTNTLVYNDSVKANSNAEYSISGLKCGDYYLYGKGIDSGLIAPENIVTGGLHIKISKDGTVKETDVYVSED